MEFTWPLMLWGLLAVPALVLGYRALLRRRAAAAARLADPHLWPHLARSPSPMRQHVPMACYLAALLLFLVAAARPVAAIPLPVNRAAIVIALDSSKSMIAQDLKPTRMDAAKAAVREILETAPRSTNVGLITFSDYGTVLVPPTTERQPLLEALERVKPQEGTAVGAAIVEALRSLPGRREYIQAITQPRSGNAPPAATPALPENLPPAAIIILSDGVSNIGLNPLQAAALAKEVKVAVYTIGVGTPEGSVMTVNNQLVLVPFDATVLQRIAQMTGGEYFPSPSAKELKQVYRRLGRQIGWERRRSEITAVVTAAGGVLLLVGGALSLVWFQRVP